MYHHTWLLLSMRAPVPLLAPAMTSEKNAFCNSTLTKKYGVTPLAMLSVWFTGVQYCRYLRPADP